MAQPAVACVGDVIIFTLNGVHDGGGTKRSQCASIPIEPGIISYTWTITKPDGTTLSGSSPVATVAANEPGTYSCSFTANATRECAPPDRQVGPKTAIAILGEVRIVRFDSDHGLMLDNNTDYEPTGNPFVEPEWSPNSTPPRNNPISHTMDQNVTARLFVVVQPADAPATTYQLVGTSATAGFNFSDGVTLNGGINLISVTSDDKIEKIIRKSTPSIEWTFSGPPGGCEFSTTTGPHTVYVTMGTPIDWGFEEFTVTQKRMERAVQQAGAANSLNPHEIVKTVIQAQGFNLLQFAPTGKAWEVPDIAGGVDCQSIVRFAKKVAKQVGCPGTFASKYIYAIETAPTVAIEHDTEGPGPCCGFNVDRHVHPTNQSWVLSLVAGGGCNAFEAAAKFTACGETRYYPAGTSKVHTNKDEVLYVFDTMSWVVEAGLPAICNLAPVAPVFQYAPKPPQATVPACP